MSERVEDGEPAGPAGLHPLGRSRCTRASASSGPTSVSSAAVLVPVLVGAVFVVLTGRRLAKTRSIERAIDLGTRCARLPLPATRSHARLEGLDAPHDREILRLAIPAFGALVAEPLYVLVDTAVVGHLGTDELAGLGVASSVLLTSYFLFVFLAYGTTGAVARLLGAGEHRGGRPPGPPGDVAGAAAVASRSPWSLAVAAPPRRRARRGRRGARPTRSIYLRISLLGTPALLVTMAGTGYLRGLQDTRTPLAVAVGERRREPGRSQLVLIYGLRLRHRRVGGLDGRRPDRRRRGLPARVTRSARSPRRAARPRLGRRSAGSRGSAATSSSGPRRCGARCSSPPRSSTRIGRSRVAAHQVAFELWSFLALSLDAVAIAGQAITGRAARRGRRRGARRAGRRMLAVGRRSPAWSGGLLVVGGPAVAGRAVQRR